jgi:hypothetical protein
MGMDDRGESNRAGTPAKHHPAGVQYRKLPLISDKDRFAGGKQGKSSLISCEGRLSGGEQEMIISGHYAIYFLTK